MIPSWYDTHGHPSAFTDWLPGINFGKSVSKTEQTKLIAVQGNTYVMTVSESN